MAARLDSPVPLVALAVIGAAALLGLLAGLSPALAVGAALGGAFVALVLESLVAGLCLMAFLAFLDALPTFGGLSAAKLVGLVLAVAWLAVILSGRGERQLYEEHPFFTYVLVLFIGWQALSLVWAEDQAEYVDSLTRYPPNLLFFPIAYAALRTERHVRLIVTAMVAAAVISAVLGVAGPASDPAAVDVGRAQGLAGGANELAAALAAGIVLCAGFAFMTWRSPLTRPSMAFAAAMCGLAIFLSLSRGGLVALGAAAIAAVVFAGRWRGRALVAAGLVALTAVGYFSQVASLPARERVLEVGGGTGRTDLWTVGWRMIEDRPVLGVGAGNFDVASIHYLLRPGSIESDEFIITAPKVAHNTLLEVFAESGVVGGGLFVAIVLASLYWMWRAAVIFERAGARDMEIIARSLLVATIGYLVAGLFISANYSKLLWLLLSLGPALYAVSRRRPASSST
jgi:O-antigen ligase